ncbi:MAG: flagellar hook-length control protein FliK [Hyphomonas sp.]|nr:flagellar hook-length control protein FliK [Hyphomonas sp.]
MSEPSSKSDETSFSSLVSRDAADNSADPNPDAPKADTALASQPEPSDTPARPKLGPALSTGEQIDPALAEPEKLLAPQLEGDARQKTTPTQTGAALTIDETVTPVMATPDTPADGSIENDADNTIQTKRAQAAILPGAASAESLQTVKSEFDAATRQSHPSDAEIEIHIETSSKSGREATDVRTQATLPDVSAPAADDPLKVIRQQDGVDLSGPDVKLAQLASDADLAQSATKTALAATTGDARAAAATFSAPDAVISIAQPASTSAPTTVASGLIPVAPSIPVAAPSEINSIILNAMKAGAEPREQLIVQLDPPELGRVAIDFKFDAQGLQQITVTSENPEALRRLRELHFELTEALREHGLSEQNLSFRQQADDQSQPAWQMAELAGPGAVLTASDDPQQATSPPPRSNAAYTRTDRLDLTL